MPAGCQRTTDTRNAVSRPRSISATATAARSYHGAWQWQLKHACSTTPWKQTSDNGHEYNSGYTCTVVNVLGNGHGSGTMANQRGRTWRSCQTCNASTRYIGWARQDRGAGGRGWTDTSGHRAHRKGHSWPRVMAQRCSCAPVSMEKPNGLQAAPPYLEALLEPKHNVDMPRIHGNIHQRWALHT